MLLATGVALATTPTGTLDANSKMFTFPIAGTLKSFPSYPDAQQFTAKNSGKIHGVQFQMFTQGTPTAPVNVKLFSDELTNYSEPDRKGYPSNDGSGLLGSTSAEAANEDGSPHLMTANFSDPPTVEKGKKYRLVLSSEAPSGSYEFWWKDGNADPYGTREQLGTINAWVPDPGKDLVYAIYVDTGVSLTLPDPIFEEATSSAGAGVTFAATAKNDADNAPVDVTCNHDSGSTFPLGTTTVTCSAADANETTGSFDVTVEDGTPPEISGIPTPLS